jgi:hypothetical protein
MFENKIMNDKTQVKVIGISDLDWCKQIICEFPPSEEYDWMWTNAVFQVSKNCPVNEGDSIIVDGVNALWLNGDRYAMDKRRMKIDGGGSAYLD